MSTLTNLARTAYKLVKALFESGFFLVAVLAIFFIAYILGGRIFLEGNFMGNDIPNDLTFINFYDRWWPKLPQWFPWQGGGVHIGIFYYELSHFLVIVIKRLSSLSVTQVLNLISFLTIPVTAIGIFLFVCKSFKNQLAGLAAAIFYMLSPVTWYSLTHGGFFAQQVGYSFIPFMFLLADWYWESQRQGRKKASIFCLTVFAVTGFFQAFSHILVFLITLAGVVLYLGFWALFYPRPGGRIKSYFREIKLLILLLAVSALVSALPFAELKTALKATGREGLVNPAAHDIPFMTVKTLFGMKDEGLSSSNWIDVSSLYSFSFFPVYIGILFAVGFVISFLRKSKVFPMALSALILMLYTTIPYYFPELTKHFTFLLSYGVRTMAVPTILVPVTAAAGLYLLIETTIFLPFWIFGKLTLLKLNFLKPLGVILASLLFLFATPFYLKKAIPLQKNKTPLGDYYRGYGPFGSSGFKEINSLWEIMSFLPKEFAVEELPLEDAKTSRDYFNKMGLGQFDRVDVSPYLGQLSANMNIYAQVPQASLYAYGFSLNHSIWGYSQGVFFSNAFGNANSMDQLAKWFGTKYIFLNPLSDPIEKYQKKDWTEVEPMKLQSSVNKDKIYARVFKNLSEPKIADWTSRPKILIIGQFKNRPYEQFFRIAIHGGPGIENALLVESDESGEIDHYPLAELKQFDALVLSAYDFKYKGRGRERLWQYIESGGRVFIDTGWQYVVPDWEAQRAPAYLPVESLTWQKIGRDWQGAAFAAGLDEKIDLRKFGKLVWGDDQWAVSAASQQAIRDWAEPVLVKDGQIVMARGKLGQGKVFWSGMNLISHILINDYNEEEIRLLNSAMLWLLEGKPKKDYQKFTISRDYPDRLEIKFDENTSEPTALYWREAYSPRLRIKLKKANGSQVKLKPYRAGTGMVLVMLPPIASGDKLVFRFVWPMAMKIGGMVSILSLLLMLLLVVDIWFLKQSLIIKVKKTPLFKTKKTFSFLSSGWIKDWWSHDNDY